MIKINKKEDCCGCGACAQICPKSCITMSSDNEGFLYPNVDLSICVNCGLCEKVCVVRHPKDAREPLRVLAAINKNDEVRMKSSSGGIFYILAEYAINKGGVVFGARFDENWQVVLDYSETLEGVKLFMGSKYVQARVENSYKDAKRFLDSGRFVLFSGTPCQISGLRSFLRKEYANLLTVDLVCHGVPSPKVWVMYLDSIQNELNSIAGIEFRNKGRGWKNFSFRASSEPDTFLVCVPAAKSHFMKAFLSDIILRPSCYECRSKSGRSHSDITLADFWGIASVFPEMDDDKGTGMVFVNSQKGVDALDLSMVKYMETSYEKVKPFNTACCSSVSRPVGRDRFFQELDSTDNLNNLIDSYTKLSLKRKCVGVYHSFWAIMDKCLLRIIGGGKIVDDNSRRRQFLLSMRILSEIEIVSVNFRDKFAGWGGYGLSVGFKNKFDKR